MAGKSATDAMQCHALNDSIRDMFEPMPAVLWEADPEKKKKLAAEYLDGTVKTYLTNFEHFFKKNVSQRGYLIADTLTYADLAFQAALGALQEQFGAHVLDQYPTLKKHYDFVCNLPRIKEYLANRPKTLL